MAKMNGSTTILYLIWKGLGCMWSVGLTWLTPVRKLWRFETSVETKTGRSQDPLTKAKNLSVILFGSRPKVSKMIKFGSKVYIDILKSQSSRKIETKAKESKLVEGALYSIYLVYFRPDGTALLGFKKTKNSWNICFGATSFSKMLYNLVQISGFVRNIWIKRGET